MGDAYQLVGNTHTLEAGADLSSYRNCAVNVNSAGKAVAPSAGGPIVGITFEVGAADSEISIQHAGIAIQKLGGTVTAGDFVKVDSSGRAVTASGADVSAGRSYGRCYVGGTVNTLGAIFLMLPASGVTSVTESESIADDADHTVNTSALTKDTLITLGTTNFVGVLADGIYVGQTKDLRVIAASGGFTYVLTPTTMQSGQPSSFTFTSKGQYVQLTWASDGWWVSAIQTAGVQSVADAATINPLHAIISLAIGAGTEDRILPNGYIPGHTLNFAVPSDGGGSTTVSGLFYDEDASADGIDLNFNDVGDLATAIWTGARWFMSNLTSVTVST